LFEPDGSHLFVREIYFFENKGTTTWNDPDRGTLRFFVPDRAENAQVMAQAPQGMPIRRAPETTGEPGVRKVDFPIKPGDSSIEVTYRLPFTTPGTFTGRVVQSVEVTRLVAPAGVTLRGDNLIDEGPEPRTRASIFTVKGTEYTIEIDGAAMETGDEGPAIQQIPPRIYDRMLLVLGLAFAILALGFLLMYRGGAPSPSKGTRAK
jgi:hypothetical protein